jgi:hypothetical protein
MNCKACHVTLLDVLPPYIMEFSRASKEDRAQREELVGRKVSFWLGSQDPIAARVRDNRPQILSRNQQSGNLAVPTRDIQSCRADTEVARSDSRNDSVAVQRSIPSSPTLMSQHSGKERQETSRTYEVRFLSRHAIVGRPRYWFGCTKLERHAVSTLQLKWLQIHCRSLSARGNLMWCHWDGLRTGWGASFNG